LNYEINISIYFYMNILTLHIIQISLKIYLMMNQKD